MYQDEYKTIEAQSEASIEDRGWKFDASVIPITSIAQIQQEIGRRSISDGVVCYAARIGLGDQAQTVSERGSEQPDVIDTLINVIDSAELTNILVLVVKSELPGKKTSAASARAYHDAALNAIQRAKKVVRILYETIIVRPGAENLDFVSGFIQDLRGKVVEITRAQQTIMTVKVRAAQVEIFKKNLQARFPKIEFQSQRSS